MYKYVYPVSFASESYRRVETRRQCFWSRRRTLNVRCGSAGRGRRELRVEVINYLLDSIHLTRLMIYMDICVGGRSQQKILNNSYAAHAREAVPHRTADFSSRFVRRRRCSSSIGGAIFFVVRRMEPGFCLVLRLQPTSCPVTGEGSSVFSLV